MRGLTKQNISFQIYCCGDGSDAFSNISSNDDTESTTTSATSASTATFKVKIMFPALSMMDLSDNKISEVPQNIHELVSLAQCS